MNIVVVGGGIVGLTSAYELSVAGCSVTLLDAGVCGAGASHGNAAKIALAEAAPVPAPGVLLQGVRWMMKPDSPLAVHPRLSPGYIGFLLKMATHCNAKDFAAGLELHLRLGSDANDLLDEYGRQGIDFEMHSRGVVLAFETEERFREQAESMRIFEAAGHEAYELHGDEVFEVEPALGDRIRHGFHFPADRQLQPDSLTSALVARLRADGVDVRERTEVTRIARSGDRVTAVVTKDGEVIATDALVLAAGTASAGLLRELGQPLPIVSGKGYSIDYRPAPITLRTSVTFEDARVAVTQLDGLLRLAGTMEFGSRDNSVNDVRVEAIRRAAREGFRDWSSSGDDPAGEQDPWAGSRPMTPDGLPVIGALDIAKNAYVNSGHSMLGLTLAPGSARLLAGLITADESTLPPELLARVSPNRF